MQKVINYGSFLQAYALKRTLEGMNHECHFIDIKPGRKLTADNQTSRSAGRLSYLLKRLDKNIIKRIDHYLFIKKREKRFVNEFFPVLGIGNEPQYDSSYDMVVIGSDEVFNCARNAPWGFAKTLLGEGLKTDRIITYAASCGHTTLKALDEYGIKAEVEKAMSNIASISVRDENTKEFAEAITGKSVTENIDPTLIYDFDELIPEGIPYKDYILIYGYNNRIKDAETIKEIKAFAAKNNKKVISAGVYQEWCDKNICCTPFELLAYFKGADYVITDTFHGTVFSIKYNKNFATIIRDSNKEKLGYLLKKFGLSSREIKNIKDLEVILNKKPEFDPVNEIIKKETCKAIEFLKDQTAAGNE